MKCNCDKWTEGIQILDGFTTLAHVHGMDFPTEYVFVFCPWCGRRLGDIDQELQPIYDYDRYDETPENGMIV